MFYNNMLCLQSIVCAFIWLILGAMLYSIKQE